MKDDKINYVQRDHNGLLLGWPVVFCKPNTAVMQAAALVKGITPRCVHRLGEPSQVYPVFDLSVIDEVHPDDYRKTALVCISKVTVGVDRLAIGKAYQFHLDRSNFPYGNLTICLNDIDLSTFTSEDRTIYINSIIGGIIKAVPSNQGYVSEDCEIDYQDYQDWLAKKGEK